MLLASTGVHQNPLTTAARRMPLMPMTSRAAPRPRLGPPRTEDPAALTAVIPTTRRRPHPPMEAHIRATSPRAPLLHPGHRQQIPTRHTRSLEDGTTRPSQPTRHTQPPHLIHTDDRRPPSRLHTPPQGILVTMTNPSWSIAKPPVVPQQPLQATTLPRMAGVSTFHRCAPRN